MPRTPTKKSTKPKSSPKRKVKRLDREERSFVLEIYDAISDQTVWRFVMPCGVWQGSNIVYGIPLFIDETMLLISPVASVSASEGFSFPTDEIWINRSQIVAAHPSGE